MINHYRWLNLIVPTSLTLLNTASLFAEEAKSPEKILADSTAGIGLFLGLVFLISALASMMALLAMAKPTFIQREVQALQGGSGTCFGRGFLTTVLAITVFILFAKFGGQFGIIALLILFLFSLCVICGLAGIAALAGQRVLTSNRSLSLSTLIGGVILLIACCFPIVGWLMGLCLVFVGMGVFQAALRDRSSKSPVPSTG